MDNIYYFETVKECEEQIVDKAIMLDLMYASNSSLFECFIRTVRTAIIWIISIITIALFVARGFKTSISGLGFMLLIYVLGCFLMSWVKFNFHRSYNNMKINLVDGLLKRCKEYQETKHEDWEEKQMLKRFGALAGIDINWNNAK